MFIQIQLSSGDEHYGIRDMAHTPDNTDPSRRVFPSHDTRDGADTSQRHDQYQNCSRVQGRGGPPEK
ncbi:hypothetical protein M8818_007072 [Zalaria obscura]|uniref:Uncharacterized protein n=1 Tax=Zalaria obscura TaxID=2024903 RepID=A0ACC3S4Q4_9PEZI